MVSLIKIHYLVACLILFSCSYGYAGCNSLTASPETNLSIPSVLKISAETNDGSIIWSSGWHQVSDRRIVCTPPENRHRFKLKSKFLSIAGVITDRQKTILNFNGIIINIHTVYDTKSESKENNYEQEMEFKPGGDKTFHFRPRYKIDIVKSKSNNSGDYHFKGGVLVTTVDGELLDSLILNPFDIIQNVPSCNVIDDNLVIDLGQHNQKEFRRVGTTTPFKSFSIRLQCNSNAKINYSVNGNSYQSNVPGLLLLDPINDSATGINVQIADEQSIPLILNKFNFWKDTHYSGITSLKLKARYYQTNSIVSPGTARATATVLFKYK